MICAAVAGHQSRDDYWRHGSICEDYAAVECAVLAVGGWADAYVDAIFRLLAKLSARGAGLIGPWGHQWPQYGHPGPQVGFLQEAVRWWDHWLKGTRERRRWTGRCCARGCPRRSARRPTTPSDRVAGSPRPMSRRRARARCRLALTADGPDAPTVRRVRSAGARLRPRAAARPSASTPAPGARTRCPADMPLDQRRDDALSLSFDSGPLAERVEIFGNAVVALRVAGDRPAAFVVARLCDVWPDGASTLVARGVLNLCHHAGHDRPQPLTPGRAGRAHGLDEERRLRGPRRPPAAAGDLDQLLAVAVAVARAGRRSRSRTGGASTSRSRSARRRPADSDAARVRARRAGAAAGGQVAPRPDRGRFAIDPATGETTLRDPPGLRRRADASRAGWSTATTIRRR